MTTLQIEMPPELEAKIDALTAEVKALSEHFAETDPYVNTAEAARLLGVSEDTVRKRARDGLIPFERPGGKNMRFRRSDLI